MLAIKKARNSFFRNNSGLKILFFILIIDSISATVPRGWQRNGQVNQESRNKNRRPQLDKSKFLAGMKQSTSFNEVDSISLSLQPLDQQIPKFINEYPKLNDKSNSANQRMHFQNILNTNGIQNRRHSQPKLEFPQIAPNGKIELFTRESRSELSFEDLDPTLDPGPEQRNLAALDRLLGISFCILNFENFVCNNIFLYFQ